MRYLVVTAAFALIILPGIGHGLWTNRWTVSKDVEEFTARLAQVPRDIGNWQCEDLPGNPQLIAKVGMTGSLSRRYTHRTSKHQLTVSLYSGPPGPVALHTPDICFPGAGYQLVSENRFTCKSSLSQADFNEATFVKAQPEPQFLETFWSWNAKGNWQVPNSPRVSFGAHRALYKLYVVCPFSKESQRKEAQDVCKDFLSVLLPELQKSLID